MTSQERSTGGSRLLNTGAASPPPTHFPTIARQSPESASSNPSAFRAPTEALWNDRKPETILDTLLRTTSFGLSGGRRVSDYQLAKAISPFHRWNTNVITCWVVTELDVTSRRTSASHDTLGPGSALYLYDDMLGRHSDGFEQNILLGTIERVEWRETGYQVYQLKVHLYSRTAEPFPILADKTYIAIPHSYIPVRTLLPYNNYVTLGQEWDMNGIIYPPRRTWERVSRPGELGWVYPNYVMKEVWKSGVKKECIREWLIAEQKKLQDKKKY